MTTEPYREDLAWVHDAGFGRYAEAAAHLLVADLRARGHRAGTVLDLGCGGGIATRRLVDAGYDAVGLDLSEAMIALARRRVPEATFRVASFVGAVLPPCVGACAVGEVLGYAFDDRNGASARAALFAEVFGALAPGGLFLFDAPGPDRAPAERSRTYFEGPDWAVLIESTAESTAEGDARLRRRIVTFRRRDGAWRRDEETHVLHLVAPETVEAGLRSCGFEVERLDAYAETALPPGLHGFRAAKPGGYTARRQAPLERRPA